MESNSSFGRLNNRMVGGHIETEKGLLRQNIILKLDGYPDR